MLNFIKMKKIALIISLVALFAINGNAQQKKYVFGLKLGPNVGWAASGSAETSGGHARMGFAVGGIVDRYFSEHVAFSSGLNLNLLGMDYTFTDKRTAEYFLEEAMVPVNRRFKGSYLEVPLKLKVKVDVYDSWKAYAEAGVGFSFNFADKCKDSFQDPFGGNYADQSYEDYFYQYRWFQTALNFGLGAMYEMNRKFSVFAQLTFNHALSNSFNNATEQQTGSIIRTNFIGLEIGITE